jgi:hypothetical protein
MTRQCLFITYSYVRMFLFLPHASLSLLSQQACAWSTFVGLQSFLTLCRHVTIIASPPPSQSHYPWPTAATLTLFTDPRRCYHCSHITPGLMLSCSRCSRPPAIVAVVVTSPPAQRHCPHVVHAPPPVVTVAFTSPPAHRRCAHVHS